MEKREILGDKKMSEKITTRTVWKCPKHKTNLARLYSISKKLVISINGWRYCRKCNMIYKLIEPKKENKKIE